MRGTAVRLLAVGMALAAAASPGALSEPQRAALTAGRAALEDELYAVAEQQFRKLLGGLQPGTAEYDEITLGLGESLVRQGRHADALAVLEPRAPPSAAWAGGYVFWRAMAGFESGDWDRVLRELESFETRFPGDRHATRAARLFANALLQGGRGTEAVAAFERFDRQYGTTPEGLENLVDWGRALLEAGDLTGAQQVLERLAGRGGAGPAADEGKYWLARVLARQGKWERAWNLLSVLANERAVPAERRAQAWLALAEINAAQTNLEAALGAVTNGIALATTDALRSRCRAYRGQLLLRQGRLDEGTAALKAVVAAAPGDPLAARLQLEVADTLLAGNRDARAAEEYQYYLETFTNRAGQAAALWGRGWSLWKLARYAEAAAAFEKAAELFDDPGRREACLVKAADAAFANGQYKLAEEAYGRAAAAFPTGALLPQVAYQRAESLARLNEGPRAESAFRDLVRRYPESPYAETALLRIAEMREEQGRMAEALAGYEELMRVYTNGARFAEALHRHGLAAYQLFRFREALQDFERVVTEWPASSVSAQADFMRGWCLYMMGRDEEAVALCRSFVARHPLTEWTPGVRFWIGEYGYNHGAFDDAEEQFRTVADAYPRHELAGEALFWAGRSAARRKEYLRAIEHYTRLAKDYPDSPRMAEARFFQGDALTELGEFAKAILIMDEIITKHRDSPLVASAWGRKGDCQFTLGAEDPRRYAEAIESYRAALGMADVPLDLRLQAECKIGRCLEKLNQPDQAVEQYYARVVAPYLAEGAGRVSPAAAVWFTRAAFGAADILAGQKKWRPAARMLERVVESGVSAARDAQDRLDRLKAEHWMLF